MSTWAIIPVIPHHKRGSRLKGVLDAEQRTELVLSMLRHMLRELSLVAAVDRVLVVSHDEHVEDVVFSYSAEILRANPAKLNDAVSSAAKLAWQSGATRIVTMPSNLGLLRASDVDTLLAMRDAFAICPDARFDDTNVMLLRNMPDFRFQFGEESFNKHLAEASRHGAVPQMAFADSFEFALKTPGDWRKYEQAMLVVV